jgi:hypothetical protein
MIGFYGGLKMPYHLCQVEDRLKQAYSRAIQQIDAAASEYSDLRSQKLEPDFCSALTP